MKERILAHFNERWYLYLIWIALSGFIFTYAIDLKVQLKPKDYMDVFMSAPDIENSSLQHYLMDAKDEYLKQVRLHTASSESETSFEKTYQLYGEAQGDLIILPESKIEDSIVTSYYLEIPEDCSCRSLFSDMANYYQVEGKDYGLLVHGKDSVRTFTGITYSSEKSPKEDYYLFFHKNSVHAGRLNHASYEGAIHMAANLENVL